MFQILEVDACGELHVPAEVLSNLSSTHRYQTEFQNDVLILRPVKSQACWQSAPPERAKR